MRFLSVAFYNTLRTIWDSGYSDTATTQFTIIITALHKSTAEHRPPSRNAKKHGPEPPVSIDLLHGLPGRHSIEWGIAQHFVRRYEPATRESFFPIGFRYFELYCQPIATSAY
ncbi:unnamed protein product [Parnassius mnemosyne]|uniref:Uncharacterized protein n=1 Tax=Parnassius mnemosyne TaxID=213953 RepID=A0AAV1L7S0_9NEOP